MRLLLRLPLFLLFTVVCGTCLPQDADNIPLIKGMTYRYEGTREDTIAGGTIMKWQAKLDIIVEDVIDRGEMKAAIISGSFWDLRLQGPVKRSRSLIIRCSPCVYFEYDGEMPEIWRRFQNPKDDLFGIPPPAHATENVLSFPLRIGQAWGDFEQVLRPDHWYCWHVVREEAFDASTVKGWTGPRDLRRFVLEYMTCPSGIERHIVPGLGVVRYSYLHHGTVDTFDLSLKEVVMPSPAVPQL